MRRTSSDEGGKYRWSLRRSSTRSVECFKMSKHPINDNWGGKFEFTECSCHLRLKNPLFIPFSLWTRFHEAKTQSTRDLRRNTKPTLLLRSFKPKSYGHLPRNNFCVFHVWNTATTGWQPFQLVRTLVFRSVSYKRCVQILVTVCITRNYNKRDLCNFRVYLAIAVRKVANKKNRSDCSQ